jgi:hypothetical protein
MSESRCLSQKNGSSTASFPASLMDAVWRPVYLSEVIDFVERSNNERLLAQILLKFRRCSSGKQDKNGGFREGDVCMVRQGGEGRVLEGKDALRRSE